MALVSVHSPSILPAWQERSLMQVLTLLIIHLNNFGLPLAGMLRASHLLAWTPGID
jgi:hypothetical protein